LEKKNQFLNFFFFGGGKNIKEEEKGKRKWTSSDGR
jgi:hypothetical protein